MRNQLLIVASFIAGCAGSTATGTDGGTSNGTVPDLYKAFSSTLTVKAEGNYVVITSTGVPDHKSPYFGSGNAKYESYNGSNPNFRINPNTISSQNLTFRIPITPSALTTPSPTPLGPIGVAINGVPLFNQYAANNQPLTNEIDSFDQYNGHPQMTGMYHYHVEPTWITRNSRAVLIGVLLDGYPVYGPIENGQLVTTASLDAAHGHFGATAEFPNGVYHYHTTSDAPYINGSGFHGSPGTVSQ
ncbi:MAG TPA: YHYH protein [Gemmatimonadaceae bacterium]|jgi:hypothetical protein|nr:YHYH protein [Gemmatimonadaceae bacterium]